MAPRLGRARLEEIFGQNILAVGDNQPGVEDIVGLGVHKPFECVGEYYEAAEALLAVLDDERWHGLPIVEALRPRCDELAAVAATDDQSGPAVHYVPARYAATLDDLDEDLDEPDDGITA
jgi:UDP-N-acetyl-alpha-D-muramoyl-L-alanyl-L-glutamate epimerase